MSDKYGEAKSITVFCSCAREDQNLLAELDIYLTMLKRAKLITVYSAQTTTLGHSRSEVIKTYLNSAQLVLLLISPFYLADPECYAQMEHAVERAQKDSIAIVPILARPTPGLELTPVADWRILPVDDKPITSWKNRDQAYNDIANEIRRLVEKLQPMQQNNQPSLRTIDTSSLLLDSNVIYPRINLTQEAYNILIELDVSGLVLTGMGGVGKSTLAALIFKYAEEQRLAGAGPFTGEALRFTLNPTVTLLDLLDALRTSLGKSTKSTKPTISSVSLTPQDQVAELFNILSRCETPRLILLDQFDAWLDSQAGTVSAEQAGVAEWLDSINSRVGPCRLLLTSRVWPQGAQTYRPIHLKELLVRGLQKDEGVVLLRQRGLQDSDADLALAVERCQGLPLALILLDKLQRGKHVKLATLLNDPNYKQLWVKDVGRNLFDSIYEQQLDDSQRDLLFAFSIYRTPVPRQAVQAVVQNKLSQEQMMAALHTLQANGLLQRYGARDGSYELHPLIAEFVRQRFMIDVGHTNSDALHDIHNLAAQYYLSQFALMLQPYQRWRIEDVAYLIEAIWHYCRAGQQQTAYDLITREHIFTDLQRWGRNAILLELYVLLLPSPTWQPASEQAAQIYYEIGDIYNYLGQKDKAKQYYEQALALFKQCKLLRGEVKALIDLGAIYRVYNQVEQALTHYQEAMRIIDDNKNEIPEKGILLHNIGRAHQSLGEREKVEERKNQYYTLALQYYEQALASYKTTTSSTEEAYTRNNIGEIYVFMKQYEQAQQYYEQALDVFLELGERRGEGTVHNNLGVLHRKLSQEQAAFKYYIRALTVFRETGDRWEEASVLKNLGRLFYMDAHYDAAIACFWLAADIADAIHKNADVRAVPNGMRRFLGEEEFERLWSQAEVRAAQILDRAIRSGINTDEGESDDLNGSQEK